MAEDQLTITDADVRSAFPEITLSLQIKDGWDFPAGSISTDQITIIEDGTNQGGVSVLPVPGPRSVALLVALDTSRSIQPASLIQMKHQALEFFRHVPSGVRVILITFDDSPIVLLDGYPSIQRIEEAIDGIERHGRRTLLYNALYDSIEILEKTGCPRKLILVYTDGKDEGSRVSQDELKRFLSDAGVVPHFVCSGRNVACSRALRLIVNDSGGTLRTLGSCDRNDQLHNDMLGNQPVSFRVRFSTLQKPDGSAHAVEVRFKSNDLRLRTSTSLKYPTASFFYRMRDIKINSLIQPILVLLFLLLLGLFLFFLRKYYLGRTSGKSDEFYESSDENIDKPFFQQEEEDTDQFYSGTEGSGDVDYISAWLMEKQGAELSGRIPLDREEMTVGSDEENAIVVKDGTVSPFHARIRQVDGLYYLFDLVSESGTFLNNKKLLRPRRLHDWDEIRVGRSSFIFRGLSSPEKV